MVKLGKLSPKKHRSTLDFGKYIGIEEPKFPSSCYYNHDITKWGMMGNDYVGDCTCAAAGHGIMGWTDDNNKLVVPPDSSIIKMYSAVSGFNPLTGANDNGAVCTDVLNYFKAVGCNGHHIQAWAQINNYCAHHVQIAIWLFGFAYIGIYMPISAQAQTNGGKWYCGPDQLGDNAPGSWGGHCVIVTGYDSEGLDVITWGTRIRMTWNFWYVYVDEAYALISQDFLSAGKAPNGFDLPTLITDISHLD